MGKIAQPRLAGYLPSGAGRVLPALMLAAALTGCGGAHVAAPANPVTSVIPSASGVPNSVAVFGTFEFVSVQGTGLILTYALNSTSQTPAAAYTTPCMDPSGMVTTTIGAANVLAVVCSDTSSLITLTIAPDGSLHPLGSVGNLSEPYPGIALDGTNLFIPLFGGGATNGQVIEVSLASPASPAIAGTVPLVSPAPGEQVNAVSLAVSGGYVYVAAGSEGLPLDSSSSIQVIGESTMTLVGSPFIVPHSPQQIAIAGTTAYVTLYDAAQLETIDISAPAALKSIALTSLTACHPVPIAVANDIAYVGCYAEGAVARLNVAIPAQPQPLAAISGTAFPQDFTITGASLLVTGASPGGALYTINLSEL